MTEEAAAKAKEYDASIESEMQALVDYDKELREEFKNAEPDEDTARRTAKRIIELVPDAANQVKYLVSHAESEAVRKDLAKWVLSVSMQYAEKAEENDELRAVLQAITGAKKSKNDKPRHLYMVGLAFATDEFDPNQPYSGCRICGAVYQTDLDRHIKTLDQALTASFGRQSWSKKHARTHTATQHRQLLISGRWCTPIAAQELAKVGVVSVVDLVMDDEISHAYKEVK